MAIKISELPAGAPEAANEVAVNQSGTTRKISAQGVADLKTWSNLAGVPSLFPPDAHAHPENAGLIHAAQHQSGGADPIKLDDLALPDDNTDLNASTTRHGLLLKLPGGTTTFLRADGTFATPAGGGGGPTTVRKTADQSSTSTTFANVTDLEFAVTANTTYHFEFVLFYTSAATTTALQMSINGPASPVAMRYNVDTQTTATARHNAVQTAYDTVTNPGTGGGSTALCVRVVGTFRSGANAGTVSLRFRTEVSGSAVTILTNSFGIVHGGA